PSSSSTSTLHDALPIYAVLQESIIFGQTITYPTISDLLGLELPPPPQSDSDQTVLPVRKTNIVAPVEATPGPEDRRWSGTETSADRKSTRLDTSHPVNL